MNDTFALFLLDKFDESNITIYDVLDGFPTVRDVDNDIPDPVFTRCSTMGDKQLLGYRGSKDDILDMGYVYLLPKKEGVNLWILTYDVVKRQWMFSFIRTQNSSEMGTKHGMLLHQIRKEHPNDLVIAAGEVIYDGDKNLAWNISSGTVTARIPMINQNKLAAYIFGKIFSDPSISKLSGLIILLTIMQLNSAGFQNMRDPYFYLQDVVMFMIFTLLKKSVFETMFGGYTQRFVFPDLSGLGAYPDFINGNKMVSTNLSEYAYSLCDKKVLKDDMYVYNKDEYEKCNADMQSPAIIPEFRKLCTQAKQSNVNRMGDRARERRKRAFLDIDL
jgi:hypothetical protein